MFLRLGSLVALFILLFYFSFLTFDGFHSQSQHRTAAISAGHSESRQVSATPSEPNTPKRVIRPRSTWPASCNHRTHVACMGVNLMFPPIPDPAAPCSSKGK
ncbi:hypothetical protein EDD15DRAFT_909078 [Pisolithus albus]|nr:hypothetical protein EDD15DRAFT_909078 [Pisolithus albus]